MSDIRDILTFPGPRVPSGDARAAEPRRPRGPRALGASGGQSVADVALLAAIGVLVVAVAFTAGRRGAADTTTAHATYWLGQLLVVVPVTVRLLSQRSRPRSEIIRLLLVLAVAEYLVKVCYSPIAFTHPDELQHWRTATDILSAGRLFTDNHALPVSPHYPGLENATAAVVSVTDLTIYIGGLIVIGVAHLAFVVLLFLLFERVAGSSRLAGVAVLVYASSPHFAFFDSLFVYGAMALPFLAASLLVARRLADGDLGSQRAGWMVLGLLAVTATVVTHHITTYTLVLLFTVIAVTTAVRQGWRAAAWPAAFAAFTAAFTTFWVVVVAPDTPSYLRPATFSLFDALTGRTPPDLGSVTDTRPFGDALLAVVATAALAVLLPIGWRQIWRTRRDDGWAVGFAVASVAWYVLLAGRLLVGGSAEIVGRAETYVYLPVGYVAAVALVHQVGPAARRGSARLITPIMLVLLASGLANGWPPYWERLPGPYTPGGFERSVSPQGVQASLWVSGALGPDNRFASDLANYSLLGTYGNSDAVRNAGPLYRSERLRRSDVDLIRAQDLRFVMTDERLARMLPPSGRYFPVDKLSDHYTRPLDPLALSKFAYIPGMSRVYDSGDIKIYDLWGAGYAR